jgi:hypothetical protein
MNYGTWKYKVKIGKVDAVLEAVEGWEFVLLMDVTLRGSDTKRFQMDHCMVLLAAGEDTTSRTLMTK